MKPNNNTTNTQAQHNYSNKHQRPENKDDLDSRANEEQDYKGDNETHNKKDTKAAHLHKNDK